MEDSKRRRLCYNEGEVLQKEGKGLKDKAKLGSMEARAVHFAFRFTLILKGLFAFSEILAGVLMVYFTPSRVRDLVELFVSSEFGQQYMHFWHEYIIDFGLNYTVGTQIFALFYLISHGVAKFIVIVLLWQERTWAYPVSVGLLLAFIAYQMARWTHTHSVLLMALTLFDIVLIALTLLEFYNILKGRTPSMTAMKRKRRRDLRRKKRREARAFRREWRRRRKRKAEQRWLDWRKRWARRRRRRS